MNLKDLIIKHERLRLFPYRCSAGKLTIGVGRNLDDVGISEEESDLMLENDLLRTWRDANSIFHEFHSYSENRRNALLDMIFNLGKSRFLKFKKMIQAVKAEDWEEAAIQATDSRWYSQVGKRADEDIKLLREG